MLMLRARAFQEGGVLQDIRGLLDFTEELLRREQGTSLREK